MAGAAESIRATSDLVRHPVDQRQWDAENRAYAQSVGADLFARHLAEGRALDLDAAVSLALESPGVPASCHRAARPAGT